MVIGVDGTNDDVTCAKEVRRLRVHLDGLASAHHVVALDVTAPEQSDVEDVGWWCVRGKPASKWMLRDHLEQFLEPDGRSEAAELRQPLRQPRVVAPEPELPTRLG